MKEMVIGFVTLGLKFEGDTLSTQGLGGSETALICMARETAARGHRVSVFCNTERPGTYDGVAYYNHQQFEKVCAVTEWDVLVASRWPEFLTAPGKAGLRVLWLHDMPTDQNRIMSQSWQTDQVFLLSDYHIKSYTESDDPEVPAEENKMPWLKPHIWKTNNGIDLDLVNENIRPKVPGKLIYTSRPERGLPHLLNSVMPKLIAEFPDVKLHYCNYSLHGMQVPENVAQAIAMSEELTKRYPDNVVNMGHLTKDKLYQEMSSAQLLLYPTEFPEISPVHGDTLIETLDGQRPIKDLVGKSGFRVYSCDSTGALSVSTVKGVFLTRKNTEMVELVVRPGIGRNAKKEKSLFLTPDHEVMLRDGSYKPAGELQPGDRVKAFARRRNEHGKGYDTIGLTDTAVVPEHRFVAEKKVGRTLAPGEVVDHQDSNTKNNTFENLKVWPSHSAHMADHYSRMDQGEKDKRTAYLEAWHASMSKEELSEVKRKAANSRWQPEVAGNHIVVAVIQADNADAFCMEVDPDHNFVANGIVVHNCITMMEAAACGTPVVSTKDFALTETVANGRTGFLIDGKPSDGDEYFSKFLRKTRLLLNSPDVYEKMSKAGPEWIQERRYTWAQVAEDWEGRFIELLTDRYEKNKVAVATELERSGDLIRSLDVLSEIEDPAVDAQRERVQFGCEVALQGTPALTDEDVLKPFKNAMARFNKFAQFMLVRGADPKVLWDFGCGDSAFALFMAKASEKCTTLAIDKDEDVLKRVAVYADKSELTNIQMHCADSLDAVDAPAPDFLFLGNMLDSHPEPWKLLEEAVAIVSPGGMIGCTTRYGAEGVGVPDAESHRRLWNLGQDDFYRMFGSEFVGHLAFHKRGVSDAGDIYGDWLTLIPVGEEKPNIVPLTADRVKLTARPYQSLAACVIAKDCEDWVLKFAKPLLEIVDKLYITLDSSSSDRTPALLAMLEPQEKVVVRYNEFDNFAAQRNFSKANVAEDWIIWVDTDEVLVGGSNLRKHLTGPILNGLSIRQNHLMLDVHGTFDVPIRVFRNKPAYNFVGCIHEHCEDTSKEGFDNPIAPAMLLNECDLAHYGYINEAQRRHKCSNRNMKLLMRDLKENPKRQLNKVLAIRDYINIVKWQADRDQLTKTGIPKGSEPQKLLEAAISTYHEFLADPKDTYHKLAFPMYQEALAFMAVNQLPVGNRAAPPFSINLALSAAIGGPARDGIDPKLVWFMDDVEYMEFMDKQNRLMLKNLGVVAADRFDADLAKPSAVEFTYGEDTPDLLTLGAGVIDKVTGKMR